MEFLYFRNLLGLRRIGDMVLLRSIILMFIYSRFSTASEYFLSNTSGEVEKGNFMYYSMSYDGTILVELTSYSGDCDLYVSQTKKKPSYEPDSYCLQSTTCGVDSVIIPKSFKRPVGIGVFGHPSHETCAYNLMFFRIDDSRDIFNFDNYQDSFETDKSKDLNERNVDSRTPKSEEESLFWVFLRSAVVFLIETIL